MRIDPHVHFRDEEQDYKETIAHGLKTAAAQGVDVVFDMPNTAKPVLRSADVKRRLALVPKGHEYRYRLYVGVTSDEEQLKEAARLVKEVKPVVGLKMFAGKSTGDLAILSEEAQKKVYQRLAKQGYEGVLVVHCEKEALMTNTFNPKDPISHARSRPCEAEVASIRDQARFAHQAGFKGTVHVCHVSCADSLKAINEARKHVKMTCGVTPHHLLWTEEKMRGEHGLLYKMNPPLRTQRDVEALREGLKNGTIDWIETDHAPHTIGEKLHEGHPSGYPSLYLYKDLVENKLPAWGLSKERIKKVTSSNIVDAFKLEV